MRTAVSCLILLGACSSYDDLALLEVEAVEPATLEPGAVLRIHGEGFPLGRVPDVSLRGVLHRPGAPQTDVDARLSGVVQSESLIEIPVDDALVEAFGGRATVDATIRVAFRSADGRRDVFASHPTRIDLLPDTPTQIRARRLREERVRDEPVAADAFGVELSREELGTAGVRILSVEPRSLAARQGVRPEDVIVGLDGVRIHSWRDFVPDPSQRESTVYLTRARLRGVHALRWPHAVTDRRLDPLAHSLFFLLGLLLGWASPAGLALTDRPSKLGLSTAAARGVFLLASAVLLATVSSLQWTTMWILVLGVFAALYTLAARVRQGVWSFAFAVVSTITVMLLARTADLDEIVRAQSSSALHWFVFRSPASCLAFAAYLHGLGLVSARRRLSASLYAAAAALVGAVLFFGGAPVESTPWAVVILTAKSAALLLASRFFVLPVRTAVWCAAAGMALAMLGLVVSLEPLFPAWSTLAVGCVTAMAVRAFAPPLRKASAPVPA